MRLDVPVRMRFADLDAYGHMNNAVLLTILEEARIAAFWVTDDVPEVVYPTAVLEMRGVAPTQTLIARQEIEYLAPIPFYRRPLVVQVWFGRLGSTSVQICFEVLSPAGDEPAAVFARASTVAVMVDGSGRPAPIPDDVRAAWMPYLEDPVELRNRAR